MFAKYVRLVYLSLSIRHMCNCKIARRKKKCCCEKLESYCHSLSSKKIPVDSYSSRIHAWWRWLFVTTNVYAFAEHLCRMRDATYVFVEFHFYVWLCSRCMLTHISWCVSRLRCDVYSHVSPKVIKYNNLFEIESKTERTSNGQSHGSERLPVIKMALIVLPHQTTSRFITAMKSKVRSFAISFEILIQHHSPITMDHAVHKYARHLCKYSFGSNSTNFSLRFFFDFDLFCFRSKCDGIDANVLLYTPAMIVPILIVSHSHRGFNGKTLSRVSCFANLDIH